MRKLIYVLISTLLISCSVNRSFTPQKTDLESQWDTLRPLFNPDKGWYHHMLDNGVGKYLIQDERDLIQFPGMDHLYLRLAWAFLEPEEGKFDWSYIDDIVKKYEPLGYGFSFRITCKETREAPFAVPEEIDGVRYATPYWVVEAGAKGIGRPPHGSASWTPEWNDPVFLEKLNNFHMAFAERYDGKPWVRYVDIGSIGEWGEGHTFYSTKIPATMEEIKTHIDMYLKHYKKSQLVVVDDLIGYERTKEEQQELLEYIIEKGIAMRDDSPMNPGHMKHNLASWSVRHPEYFEKTFKKTPNVFELAHYIKVKDTGQWIGKNGEGKLPEYGVSGADVFRNAVKIIRPTYIGFHGYLNEWLSENPELTNELLNLCGYWYFPKSINTTQFKNGVLTFKIEWLNKGVAPAYSTYQLKGKLIAGDNSKTIDFVIENSENINWLPGETVTETYRISFPEKPKGKYLLAIQLFDKSSKTPVDIGLRDQFREDNFFVVQKLSL